MSDFGEVERKVCSMMAEGTRFSFRGKDYRVIISGKPTCSKGEPKTDIYILAQSDDDTVEIKISYKKENADFIDVAAQNFCQNFSKLLTKLFGKYFRYL